MLTRVILPADAPRRSIYMKVRERESGDFALVSVAAALWLDGAGPGAAIRQARIALGGVAPVPYRAAEVETALAGRPAAAINPSAAAALALPHAIPLPQNGYKIPMARNLLRRALAELLAND